MYYCVFAPADRRGVPISFEATKLLSLLVYPLTQVFLLQVLALLILWRGRRRTALIIMVAGLAWFYLVSTEVFGGRLMHYLERPYPPVAAEALPEADVIVLLGGGVHSRKSPQVLGDLNRWSDRLLFATALYKAGKAPMIVLSGGGPDGRPTESALSRDILQVMGVPVASLLLEQNSRDTYGNALHTAPLLRQRGWERVLLVTSAFHMRRAVALFAAQGITVIPAPTDHFVDRHDDPGDQQLQVLAWLPTLKGMLVTHYAMHELVGFGVYRLRGWL
jgi:uncharacterized SAM-binding protein YcdF (DUF218 family)